MKRAIILSILLFVVCDPAGAALVTIAIEGVVDYVDDPYGLLPAEITPGDAITGIYTYDTATADSNPFSMYGSYRHVAPYGIFLTVGDLSFESSAPATDFLVGIGNDYPPNDDYYLLSYNNYSLSNGTPVDYISWQLDDPTGTALSSTDLTGDAPILSNWQSNILSITADRMYAIKGHVESVTIVPEPATPALLAIGALAMGRKRHRCR